MTARLLFANVAAFGLQVTVLVAAGAALARAFRIDEPRAMLGYWRLLLAACLMLPFCQPWDVAIPPALVSMNVDAPASLTAVESTVHLPAPSTVWPLRDVTLAVLAAGIAARGLWLAIGACRLRRLRREALPLEPLPERLRRAQEQIGTRAGIYISERVTGPITFGLLRPIVVFPPTVPAMPAHVQEAIAYHELLHVRRRDWAHEIVEEIVRTVLWFHPAVWWLVGRIRLTREQVVDRATIQLTQSRERYVDALLAVALANSPALAPASPFLRRHLLKQRVARIMQETTMTTRRLIASLAASAAVLALASVFAVRSFPLEAQGRAPSETGDPIQIVKGAEHLLHGELPEYPPRAVEHKVEGDVVVDLTVDERGEVSDARVLSGPEELRRAALQAVLGWHYSPAAISSTITQAALRFRVPPKGLEKAEFEGKIYFASARLGYAFKEVAPEAEAKQKIEAEHRMVELKQAIESERTSKAEREALEARYAELKKAYDLEIKEVRPEEGPHLEGVPGGIEGGVEGGVPGGVPGGVRGTVGALGWKITEVEERPRLEGPVRLVDIRTERVSQDVAKQLVAQAGVTVGDLVTEESLKRIQKFVATADEHLRVEYKKGPGGLYLMILTR
jgi:TonB family protein